MTQTVKGRSQRRAGLDFVRSLPTLPFQPNVPAAVRLRAAECVFDRAIKGIELEDIEARVAALEATQRRAGHSADEDHPKQAL